MAYQIPTSLNVVVYSKKQTLNIEASRTSDVMIT